MFASRVRGALSLCAVLAVAACGSSSEPNPGTSPSAVDIVSGNGQVGLVGVALSLPLTVRVSANGNPVTGVTVTFAVASGAATVSPGTATTDATGQAKTQVTLGSAPGNITITAKVSGTNLVATFLETAGTSNVTLACQPGTTPTTPAVGAVVVGVAGTGVCLGGGTAGADYALVAFHANPDPKASALINVASRGATALSTASIAPNFDQVVSAATMRGRANNIQAEIEGRLRRSERLELTPMIPAARAAYRRRSAAFSAVPANPTVGALFTLNTAISPACTSPINVITRVAAVSNLAIVLADTANPAGGFTDAEYAQFGAMFDTLVSPLDVATFGAQSDIDNNGKILILFTKEVNKLTPRGSNGVFGGFFHIRDLFPKVDTNGLQGCAGSNFAEMYYSMVPDPGNPGKFGDTRSKASVQNLTPSTLVHEFQHLINASRRLYVNDADVFEEVWLNEGLSHVAEELLYFRVAKLAPRANIGVSVIGADTNSVNNFNNFQGDNFGRFESFMATPASTSVYAQDDSLETRGATWNLLRYLADHRGTSDGDTWMSLSNTTLAGQQNLSHVFGTNFLTQIRDWTTALFADDLTGQADARFSAPSWNMRNIFPRLVDQNGKPLGIYPLRMIPLADALPANVSVVGGAAAYIRFTVPANTSASIDWSSSGLPVSPFVQFSVVRSR